MTSQAVATVPFGRRRFLVAAVAAALAVSGAPRARPLCDAMAPLAGRPREVPLAALDLRAPHGLAG